MVKPMVKTILKYPTLGKLIFISGVLVLPLLLLILLGVFSPPTQAITAPVLPATGERVALVLGNASYKQLDPLANSVNDARAIARLLGKAGFEVDLIIDGNQSSIQAGLQRLSKRLQEDKVEKVMFFYAGHAVQLDWRNFLIGVDARITKIEDVPNNSLDVADVLAVFSKTNSKRNKQFVVILDACRDNPFPANVKLPKKGLSQFDAPPNTLVAFSTAPGQVAYDGDDDNSFYTSMLLREMSVPYIPLEDALKRVRMGVRISSLGRQIPWESTSLEEKFYLYPPPLSSGKLDIDQVEANMKQELDSWLQVKQNPSVSTLASFVQKFPSGNLVQLAQHMLDDKLHQMAKHEATQMAQQARNTELPQSNKEDIPTKEIKEVKQDKPITPPPPPLPERIPQAAPKIEAAPAPAPVIPASPAPAPKPIAPKPIAPTPLRPLEQAFLNTAKEFGLPSVVAVNILAKKPPLEITVAPAPSFSGAEPLNRKFRIGDHWKYQVHQRSKNTRSTREIRITNVQESIGKVTYQDYNGESYFDLMGNALNTDRGKLDYPRQFYPAILQVGARWVSSFTQSRPDGSHYTFRYDLRIVQKETISVPAGRFEVYRIEANGVNLQLGSTIQRLIWVAPGINANIAVDVVAKDANGRIEDDYRWELETYQPIVPALGTKFALTLNQPKI